MRNLLFIFILFFFSCSTNKTKETIEVISSNKDEIKTKQDRKMEIVTLLPFKSIYTVVVGQKLEYTASIHGSVGNTTEVSAPDDLVIKMIDSEHQYNNPAKSNMSGGDAATVKYTFEALKPGIGHVIIVDSFRGEVQNTYELEITVE